MRVLGFFVVWVSLLVFSISIPSQGLLLETLVQLRAPPERKTEEVDGQRYREIGIVGWNRVLEPCSAPN